MKTRLNLPFCLLTFFCCLVFLPGTLTAQPGQFTAGDTCINHDGRISYYATVDTAASLVLHPFLFRGGTFVENGADKFIYPFPTPDQFTDFVLVKAYQDGTIEWARHYGTANFKDIASSVKPTADGNFIVSGVSESISNNKNYPFLMKIDPLGNILWQQSYPNGHNLGRVKAVELQNGNFAACSYHNNWKYNETGEMVVFLTDPTGGLITYQQFGNNNRKWDHLRAITATSDGGFAVCGANGHNYDYVGGLIIKFDAAANMVWEQVWRLNTPSSIYSLPSSNSDDRRRLFLSDIVEVGPNLYVAGNLDDAHENGTGSTMKRGFLAEVIPGGAPGWAWSYAYDPAFSMLYSLTPSSLGGFVATGRSKDSGKQRTWMIKVDAAGMLQWSNVYGGAQVEFGSWVSEGQGNNYIVTGLHRSTSSAASIRPYHMKVNSAGIGDEVCHSVAPATFQQDPFTPQNPSYVYQAKNNLDLSQMMAQASCPPTYQCLDYALKLGAANEPIADQKGSWTVYPNPGRGAITLEQGQNAEAATSLEIVDLTGRVLLRHTSVANSMRLNLAGLESGVYFIRILSESGHVQNLKWVRQ